MPPIHHHERARREGEGDLERGGHPGRETLVDPFFCQMATPHTPPLNLALGNTEASTSFFPLREDLQNLLSGLARRVAWGGDRRKGSARIELAEGALAGATLLVHTDERAVTVEIELPGGAGGTLGLEQRILERLEGRGFAARVRVA